VAVRDHGKDGTEDLLAHDTRPGGGAQHQVGRHFRRPREILERRIQDLDARARGPRFLDPFAQPRAMAFVHDRRVLRVVAEARIHARHRFARRGHEAFDAFSGTRA
jgi:hypothetical protein